MEDSGRSAISKRIIEIVAQKCDLDPSSLTECAKFADLPIDSLGQVEMVMAIEDEFSGVSISDEELGKLEKISCIVDLIEKFKKD